MFLCLAVFPPLHQHFDSLSKFERSFDFLCASCFLLFPSIPRILMNVDGLNGCMLVKENLKSGKKQRKGLPNIHTKSFGGFPISALPVLDNIPLGISENAPVGYNSKHGFFGPQNPVSYNVNHLWLLAPKFSVYGVSR